MATLSCPVARYEATDHPNADMLEIALVGEWRVVCRIGRYQRGQKVAHVPENAVLSDELMQEMKLKGKLDGPEKNMVKAKEIRGELSQGYLYSGYRIKQLRVGDDATEALGLKKWKEPSYPVHMGGPTERGPSVVFDVEHMKNYPDTLQTKEQVVVTEKLHGTFCCLGYQVPANGRPGQIIVASKGNLKKGKKFIVDHPRNATNVYVQAWHEYGDRIRAAVGQSQYLSMMFMGEIYGAEIQDLTYEADKPVFRLFDVKCDDTYLNWDEVKSMAQTIGAKTVPELWRGPWSGNVTIEHSSGQSTIADHMREGIVVRPLQERFDHGTPDGYTRGPGRVLLKVINDEYLLRKKGTEYN